MHDIKKLMTMIKDHGDEATLNKLSNLVSELISESGNLDKYEMDFHILEHGYHFDEVMYKRAMSEKDAAKWSPETACSLLDSHGVTFTNEYSGVTKYDKAYVMNTLYKSYYPLITDSSTTAKFAEKYIKCPYPVPGGRAFIEWMTKCKFKSEMDGGK